MKRNGRGSYFRRYHFRAYERLEPQKDIDIIDKQS